MTHNEQHCLERPHVLALDEILGQPFKVLDDGFVRVVDYMGSDASIIQAARVSYGVGTRRVHEDRGLIRYLMRHHHTTPFEMCELKLHVRVPMECWRQWIRHRTANVNEYSTRYSIAIDAAQMTPSTDWRLQSPTNRQGSAGLLNVETGVQLSQKEAAFHHAARELYEERLALGDEGLVFCISGESSFAPLTEGVALGVLHGLASRHVPIGVETTVAYDARTLERLSILESLFGIALALSAQSAKSPNQADVHGELAAELWGRVLKSRGA